MLTRPDLLLSFVVVERVGGKDGNEYQREFWAECDDSHPKLSQAQGLYVYSVRFGNNLNPHYVGMTKKGFNKEVSNLPTQNT